MESNVVRVLVIYDTYFAFVLILIYKPIFEQYASEQKVNNITDDNGVE